MGSAEKPEAELVAGLDAMSDDVLQTRVESLRPRFAMTSLENDLIKRLTSGAWGINSFKGNAGTRAGHSAEARMRGALPRILMKLSSASARSAALVVGPTAPNALVPARNKFAFVSSVRAVGVLESAGTVFALASPDGMFEVSDIENPSSADQMRTLVWENKALSGSDAIEESELL